MTRLAPLAFTALVSLAQDDPPARLLLVTLDTTRADRVGCYGCAAARTPTIDALAARGVLYEQAWSSAPVTLSAHATILTGVYPCAHGVRENGAFELAPSARLLSEALKESGFRTGAFVASFVLDPRFGLDQGFDVYDAPGSAERGGLFGQAERPASAVADAALRFVDSLGARDRFFLWVHFYDAHHPYQPPAEFAESGLDPYDGEIAACDAALRRVVDGLRQRGLDEGLVVAVVGDHGESLGEHGEKHHGTFVYEATMRVPLIVAPPPKGVVPGTRLSAPVSIADLAPTLLERLSIGRSSLPDATLPTLPNSDASGGEERALYLESFSPYYTHKQHPLRAVVWKGFKFVEAPQRELYSLADDPREARDLSAERAELCARLAARLAALGAEHRPLGWSGAIGQFSLEDARKLEQLGYAAAEAGGDPLGEPEEEGLPDPKACIGDVEVRERVGTLMKEATELIGGDPETAATRTPESKPQRRRAAGRKLAEARELVMGLRARNPRDPFVDWSLGTIETGLGRFDEAAAVYERIVAGAPRNASGHFNLANAYLRTGHVDWARREMEKAAWLEPKMVVALRWLVQQSLQAHDEPAAAWWLGALLECPGLSDDDRTAVAVRRSELERQLDLAGAKPAAPAPLTDEQLAPEGERRS